MSRDRYWGTPLPIWRCPAGHVHCVASLAELSELAGTDVTDVDPHRPAIDEVTFACPECGEPARSGRGGHRRLVRLGFHARRPVGLPARARLGRQLRLPADFVAEAIDQTRGWFYSLLAVNVLVFNQAPYRTVLSLGHLVDTDGRKMSKSLGNVVDPWAILDTRGAPTRCGGGCSIRARRGHPPVPAWTPSTRRPPMC